MKRGIYAMMLASAVVSSFSSCNKESKPEPVVKDAEAKLLTLSVTSGDVVIEGTVYENDKVVELVYLPEQLAALTGATATITVSEGATVAPDPSVARDYTQPVEYVVTSSDKKKEVTYKVEAVVAKVQVTCEPAWETPKTYADLGLPAYKFNDGQVAFSGVDRFVTHDCQVFDLSGKKVGELNTEGLPNKALIALSNDEKGVLLATTGESASGASEPTSGDDTKNSKLWAWKDGWDKAPVLLYQNEANVSKFMSVSGDIKGDYIVTIISGGRNATRNLFHCFVGKNGQNLTDDGVWRAFYLDYPANDGNWSQMVSPASGDPNGMFFMFDSRSNNLGGMFLARQGIEGEDIVLNGTIADDEVVDKEHSGANQYGNYSAGHVRAFMYNGEAYCISASSGWPSAYFCIQPADAEKEYILRSIMWGAASPRPSSAYVYDPATDTGHVMLAAADYQLQMYDIKREIL